ncbi:MAG TPA: tripartite tricarboxylate transporter substrate-binding protein [Alphaproteobacteria bacterium]
MSLSAPSHAQQRDAMQSLSLVVGTGVGGGYDTYGRLVSMHLPRMLPSRPSVIVKNMAGAGGIVASNWLYNIAPKDGSVIATVPGTAIFQPLLGNAQGRFDARQFTWLGNLNFLGNVIIVWHATPFKSVQDLFDKEVIVGAAAGVDVMPNFLNKIIGTKFKVIGSYPGTTEVFLAMERGEVDGVVGIGLDSLKATKSEWIKNNQVRMLMQITSKPEPDLQGVPFLMDYVKSEEDRKVLELALAKQNLGRPFLAPPDIPAKTAETLQKAFIDLSKDPEFLSEAARLKLDIQFTSGPDVAKFVTDIYATPQNIVERAVRELETPNQ